MAQDTFFRKKKLLNCRGRLLDLSTPAVMGILNITPDSFYKNSRISENQDAVRVANQMVEEGAAIIDLGAQSTRPGANLVDPGEEWERLAPVLKILRKELPGALISVDTFYAVVAEKALGEGADMINDVSGGTLDEKMFDVPGKYKVPYVLMHIRGTPQTMQQNPEYENVTLEVLKYFAERIEQLKSKGVNDIIIDPGFGFGKNMEHNYTLLKNLEIFSLGDCPILVGISRKSMVSKILDITQEESLNGTTALHTMALIKGVDILRVHDVKEAVEVVKLVTCLENSY